MLPYFLDNNMYFVASNKQYHYQKFLFLFTLAPYVRCDAETCETSHKVAAVNVIRYLGTDQLNYLYFCYLDLSVSYFIYRYMEWVFSKYAVERNDEVRLLLMKAMAETLRLEGEMPKLKDFSAVSVFFLISLYNIQCTRSYKQ